MARISKYEEWEREGTLEDKLLIVAAWARDGLVQQQICDNLGISIETLIEYKKKYPLFAEALKKGKEIADIHVVNALFKRAIGYDYEETITEETDKGTSVKVIKKHSAPDVTAQIYWLKNRLRGVWRDKPEEESGKDNSIIELAKAIREVGKE